MCPIVKLSSFFGIDDLKMCRSKSDVDEFEEKVTTSMKKSSTILTCRRLPDGIGVLRVSFSSPGAYPIEQCFSTGGPRPSCGPRNSFCWANKLFLFCLKFISQLLSASKSWLYFKWRCKRDNKVQKVYCGPPNCSYSSLVGRRASNVENHCFKVY